MAGVDTIQYNLSRAGRKTQTEGSHIIGPVDTHLHHHHHLMVPVSFVKARWVTRGAWLWWRGSNRNGIRSRLIVNACPCQFGACLSRCALPPHTSWLTGVKSFNGTYLTGGWPRAYSGALPRRRSTGGKWQWASDRRGIEQRQLSESPSFCSPAQLLRGSGDEKAKNFNEIRGTFQLFQFY